MLLKIWFCSRSYDGFFYNPYHPNFPHTFYSLYHPSISCSLPLYMKFFTAVTFNYLASHLLSWNIKTRNWYFLLNVMFPSQRSEEVLRTIFKLWSAKYGPQAGRGFRKFFTLFWLLIWESLIICVSLFCRKPRWQHCYLPSSVPFQTSLLCFWQSIILG